MKKKGNPEFFEVFRRLPDTQKPRSWWSRSPKPSKPAAAAPVRDATTPAGRTALTFSREALMVLVPLVLIGLVVSHIWGYRRGVNNAYARRDDAPARTERNEVAQGAGHDQRLMNMPATDAVAAPFWTLQLITLMSGQRQNATDIAAELRKAGYDAFARKVGSMYTVNVGHYRDGTAAKESRLQERFKQMKYGNDPAAFRSAQYVQVTDTGSILR